MEEDDYEVMRMERELDDLKGKVRKLTEELDEKNEVIIELKELIEKSTEANNRLRSENLDLLQEARNVKILRDEVDILSERVRLVDRLESDVKKYKEKVADVTYLKTRMDEVREENRILLDSKEHLESQLEVTRKKLDSLTNVERELVALRATNEQLNQEIVVNRTKSSDLFDEVNRLRLDKKNAADEVTHLQEELNRLRGSGCCVTSGGVAGSNPSLLEQLNSDASKRILKLELQNQKLLSLVDGVKGQTGSGLTTSTSPTTSSSSSSSSSFHHHQNGMYNKRYSIDCDHPLSSGQITDSFGEEDDLLELPEVTFDGMSDSGCASLGVELANNLASRLERMEKQNLQLISSLDKIRDSEKKISDLEGDRLKMENESRELHLKVQSLELDKVRSRQESEDLRTTIDSLTVKNNQLQTKIGQLESENKNLKSIIDEVKRTPLTDWTSSTTSISICRSGQSNDHQGTYRSPSKVEAIMSKSPPTTPTTSSPFIRGTCRSSSVNFGSLSAARLRQTALAIPSLRGHPQQSPQSGGWPNNGYPPSSTQTIINVTTVGREPSAKASVNGHHRMTGSSPYSSGGTTTSSLIHHRPMQQHHNHQLGILQESPSSSVVTSIKKVTVESTISVQAQKSPSVRLGPSLTPTSPSGPRTISPTPSTVGTDSIWYEYGCV